MNSADIHLEPNSKHSDIDIDKEQLPLSTVILAPKDSSLFLQDKDDEVYVQSRALPTSLKKNTKGIKVGNQLVMYGPEKVKAVYTDRTGFSVYNVQGKGKVFMAMIDETGEGGWKTSATFTKEAMKSQGDLLSANISKLSGGSFTIEPIIADKPALAVCPQNINPPSKQPPGSNTSFWEKQLWESNMYIPGKSSGGLAQREWNMKAREAIGLDKYAALTKSDFYSTVIYISEKCPTGWSGYADVRRTANGTLYLKSKMPNTMLHEYLHNMGCEHSMYNNDEYGDTSCVMGRSAECVINAAQTYRMGWLSKAQYLNIGEIRAKLEKEPPLKVEYAIPSDDPTHALVIFQEVIPFTKEGTNVFYSDSVCHALYFISLRKNKVYVHSMQRNIDSNGMGDKSQLHGILSVKGNSVTLDLTKINTRWYYLYRGRTSISLDKTDEIRDAMKLPVFMTKSLKEGNVKQLVITLQSLDVNTKKARISITKS